MKESQTIKILIFSCLIFIILGGFLMLKQGWFGKVSSLSDIVEKKIEQISILKLTPKLIGFNEERNYLLLFQNNLELRPTGGYLGSFGIIKFKDGKPIAFEMHDTNIFDGFGKTITDPPYPLKEYLNIDNWQMRDSNWSPDFMTSAQQVEYFYRLQGGSEAFDGIIAVNATILPKLLELTNPIYLEEFSKEFKSQDVLYQLEYEVERGYIERGIDSGERKAIFKSLVHKILDKIAKEDIWQESEFRNLIINELDTKNILIFLKDTEDQKTISNLDWHGGVNQDYENNYLMLTEANLMGRKSNMYIEREVEYFVDFSKERPEVNLKIKFSHSKKEKDWFNEDYRCYLRVYVPLGSYLVGVNGVLDKTGFFDEFNKTSFGNFITIPAGEEKIIEFKYLLPKKLKDNYDILVQKQPGIDKIPIKYMIKNKEGQEYKLEKIIDRDWEGIVSF